MAGEKVERKFTIQGSDIGLTGGKYVAPSPSAAGKKAARRLFQVINFAVLYHQDKKQYAKYAKYSKFLKFKGVKVVKFLLRETTRGSDKNTYTYEGLKSDLTKPIVFKRAGVEVTVNHKIDIKTCKEF